MSNRKRGSIALARSLCYQINGAADDSDDMDGGGYGSVDIAEILSAEVVRLKKALAQPEQQAEPVVDCPRCGHCCPEAELVAWAGLTDEDWEKVENRKNTVLDTFEQGATWAAYKLERLNT